MPYRCCRPRALVETVRKDVRTASHSELRQLRRCAWPLTLLLVLLTVSQSYAKSKLAGKYTKAGGNLLAVSSVKDGEVQISMFGSYHENTCTIETDPLKLSDGVVTYEPSDDRTCTVRVTFRKKSATVEQKGICGCGLNVNLSGEYKKSSSSKSPKKASNPN